MSADFEKLKLLTVDEISEKTHITKSSVNNILSKNFDKFDKIQFNGFVSILEREYSLNLQELRDEYQEYMITNGTIVEPTILVAPDESDKPKGLFLIFILAMIVLAIVWFIYAFVFKPTNHQQANASLNTTTNPINKITAIDTNSSNTSIDNVNSIDINSTNSTDINSTNAMHKLLKPKVVLNKTVSSKQTKHKQQKIVPINLNLGKTSLNKNDINGSVAVKQTGMVKLFTKAKLWLGITNMKTWKQQQKIVSSSLDLNSTGDYLLILGHGMVQIQTGDKNISFPQTKTVFLMLKNGKITQLNRAKFSKLNKGKLW